ncbi:site-specific integrase [Alkalibacterium sp. s-m-22]
MERKEANHEESGYQKPTYETFEEIYELWFNVIYKEDVRESTAVKTRELFDNHVLKDLGRLRIQAITPAQCQEAVFKWSERISKAKVMKNYCKRIFDYAITLEKIRHNPMDRVHVPKMKKENKRDINFYTKDELKRFLECVQLDNNPRWFPMFRLLAFSGMRKGEALALTWQDFNFETNTVTIDKTLARGKDNSLIVQSTKTTAGERTISLDPITIDIIKEWRKTQRLDYLKLGMNTNTPDQVVFTTLDNEYIQHANLTSFMNKIIEKHELKRITPHELRHTHCSILFEAGAGIKDVQERLGHSSYEVTMNIYTHVTEEAKEKTADIFARHVGF